MKILIIGSNGIIGSYLRKKLIENNFLVSGISKSKAKFESKKYNHHCINITSKDAHKKVSNLLKKHDLCIFCINKNEKPKGFVYDINLLLKYHVFFLYRILKNQRNKKIIVINSNAIIKKVSNFQYTLAKNIKHTMTIFSDEIFKDKINMYSIILGKVFKHECQLKKRLFKNVIKITQNKIKSGVISNF